MRTRNAILKSCQKLIKNISHKFHSLIIESFINFSTKLPSSNIWHNLKAIARLITQLLWALHNQWFAHCTQHKSWPGETGLLTNHLNMKTDFSSKIINKAVMIKCNVQFLIITSFTQPNPICIFKTFLGASPFTSFILNKCESTDCQSVYTDKRGQPRN